MWAQSRHALLAATIFLSPFVQTAESQPRPRPSRNEQQLPPGMMQFGEATPEQIEMLIQHHRGQLERRDERQREAARSARRLKNEYEDDPSAEQAAEILYRAGYQSLQAENWETGEETLRQVVADHPDSIWAFEARICLHDFAWEISLDPDAAAAWLSPDLLLEIPVVEPPAIPEESIVVQGLAFNPDEELPLEVPGPEHQWTVDGLIVPRSSDAVRSDIELRLGLLPAWDGDFESARPLLEAARRGGGSDSPFASFANAVVHDFQFPHPYPEALADDARVAQLMRYSVVLIEAMKSYRAHRMLDALIRREGRDMTPVQRSFLVYRRAFARYRMANAYERDPPLILEDYELAVQLAEDAPWAAHALYLAANAAGNLAQDPERAIEFFRRVFDQYPADGLAPMSAFTIGAYYEDHERWIEAYDMFCLAYERDPAGYMAEEFREHIDDLLHHIPEDQRRELREPTPANDQ